MDIYPIQLGEADFVVLCAVLFCLFLSFRSSTLSKNNNDIVTATTHSTVSLSLCKTINFCAVVAAAACCCCCVFYWFTEQLTHCFKKTKTKNQTFLCVQNALRFVRFVGVFDVVHHHLDDLEVEIVAALEAQLQQENRDIIAGHIDDSWSAASPSSAGSTPANQSPKEHRKLDHNKKRWKNWGWKYSPGGKTSSIEEEPESPKQSTSRLSSPANSPKHRSTKTSDGSLEPATGSSPLRRQKSPSPSAISGTGSGNRSSAGARLCQMIDDSQDESGDELQALLINGRPASVHIVQLTSGKSINWAIHKTRSLSADHYDSKLALTIFSDCF